MEHLIVIIIFVVVAIIKGITENNKKKNSRDASQSRRGPVIGTPVRQYSRNSEPQDEDNSPRQEDIIRPVQLPSNDQKLPSPLLKRNPYAERSDYGTSPLESYQPPKQDPVSAMCDQAFLTAEDHMTDKEDDTSLPLEMRQKTTGDLMNETVAKAFPNDNIPKLPQAPGIHNSYKLNAKGSKNLKKAVVMAEVVARPRAYDL